MNETIGIMCAMSEELAPLLSQVQVTRKHHISGTDFYDAVYNNRRVILTSSGIGKVQAALASTILIEHFDAKQILFSGVAGGIVDSLKVGDVVVASRLAQFDVDLTTFGHPKGHIPGSGVYVQTSKSLRYLAEDLGCVPGTIVSGDKFVDNTKEKMEISKEFNAIALEMEGASVAFVCQAYNIPCLVIRSISDTLHGSSEDFGEFLAVASINSAKMVLGIVNGANGAKGA